MLVIDSQRGLVEVDIETDEVASAVGGHHNAVRRYLETGDDDPLRSYATKRLRIGGEIYELETDRGRIEDLAWAGDLGYDDIYVIR